MDPVRVTWVDPVRVTWVDPVRVTWVDPVRVTWVDPVVHRFPHNTPISRHVRDKVRVITGPMVKKG